MPIIADVGPTQGPTLDQLVTEIIAQSQGFSISPERIATLKDAITQDALTMVVQGDNVSAGVFEVGDELILVSSVDDATGTCVIHPRGRGWQGTVAVAHDADEIVVSGPALPRARVVAAINDTINSVYPAVFGIASVTGSLETDGTVLELPADAEAVLEVRVENDGDWERVRYWETEVSTLVGTTTRGVRLPRTSAGDTVQVIYSTRPQALSASGQHWSDTGLSLGVKDIVVMGVLARFAQSIDLGRLGDRFVTPNGDAQQPQISLGFQMARQLRTDFQAALALEATALRNLYPARSHFVR